MSIGFNTIVSNIRTNTHHLEVDNSRAVQGLNLRKHVILVLGRNLPAGTSAPLVAEPIKSGNQAEQKYGAGSELAEEIRAGKAANSDTEVWGMSLDPLSGGTAGIITATVLGTVTVAGTIPMYIAGRYVAVPVLVGDDPTAIALAITTAYNAHAQVARMPFTAAPAAAVASFTMKWKGAELADVRFHYNDGAVFPAGVTSITVAVGTPGAGNPNMATAIAALGDEWFDTIIDPFNDDTNQGLLDTEMARRFGGMVQLEGVVFSAVVGTHGETSTEGNGRNSPHRCLMGANQSPTPSWVWAAVTGFVDAFEPDPARPRQTLALPGCLPASRTLRWKQSERNTHLYDGVSTHVVDPSGAVTIERLITTYQTNTLGIPDPSFLNITTMRTLAAIRFDRRSAISLSFPRHKLMDDGQDLPPGQPVVTPNTIRAHGLAQFQRWQANGWVENFEQFKDEYIVLRDPTDVDRVQEQMSPDLMNQFRGLSGQIQFLLSAAA